MPFPGPITCALATIVLMARAPILVLALWPTGRACCVQLVSQLEIDAVDAPPFEAGRGRLRSEPGQGLMSAQFKP